MKTFGERLGFTTKSTEPQDEEIDAALRASIWNVLNDAGLFSKHLIDEYSKIVWSDFFKEPHDERPINNLHWGPDFGGVIARLRNLVLKGPWITVYEFVEFTLAHIRIAGLEKSLDQVLERENSAYRLASGVLVSITGPEELAEVAKATEDGGFPGAAQHILRAAQLLSDRKTPDYRNSVKESISAVESVARKVSGREKATLSDALKVIERHQPLHPALNEALQKLYGYTSDEQGIRHSLSDEKDISQADARYFLIVCSAFVNYLKQLAAR